MEKSEVKTNGNKMNDKCIEISGTSQNEVPIKLGPYEIMESGRFEMVISISKDIYVTNSLK